MPAVLWTDARDMVELTPTCFLSNHILVNRTRLRKGLPKLRRNRCLDELARSYATTAAKSQDLDVCLRNLDSLRSLLGSSHVGQNVQKGSAMIGMHQVAMDRGVSSRANLLSAKFLEFGIATAKANDGELYMIQFFRGPTTCDLATRVEPVC
jgi:uncharacterized protein YkwD